MTTTAALVLVQLTKKFGNVTAVDGINLRIPAGSYCCLLGPSGCGKTSTLRMIAGHESATSGDILVGPKNVTDLPPAERNTAMMFQSYALWPHRSVFDNVAYGLKLRGTPTPEIKTRVDKTLAQIGLGNLAERYPHQLSGGQQQRVAIARALVYEPPVILLDEPLSNLDAKLREEARGWLRTLIVTLGLSAIHVTHDQVEAMAIADRVVLLENGVVAQVGPPPALYNEPATLFAAEFMGSNNRLDGTLLEISGARATMTMFGENFAGMARTKAAVGSKAVGIIRLERVRCAASAGPNRLKMELKTPMYLGERWELVFAREGLTVRAYASAPLPPGEHFVEFPPEALWVF